MTKDSVRKEGDLSPEEEAIAKKIFVAFGFLGLALVITAVVSLIPVQYVLPVIIAVGIVAAVRSELIRSHNHAVYS